MEVLWTLNEQYTFCLCEEVRKQNKFCCCCLLVVPNSGLHKYIAGALLVSQQQQTTTKKQNNNCFPQCQHTVPASKMDTYAYIWKALKDGRSISSVQLFMIGALGVLSLGRCNNVANERSCNVYPHHSIYLHKCECTACLLLTCEVTHMLIVRV